MSNFFPKELKHKISLGVGALLALLGIWILVWPDSTLVAQRKSLGQVGVIANGKATDKFVHQYASYDNSSARLPGRAAGVASSVNAGARAARIMNGTAGPENGTTLNYDHYVVVEFKTERGEKVTAELEIQKPYYAGIKPGTPVDVLYHPANPHNVARAHTMAKPEVDIDSIYRMMACFVFALAMPLLWFGRPRGGDGDPEPIDAASAATARLNRVASQPRQRVAMPETRNLAPRRTNGGGNTARPVRRFGQATR